ncbi:SIMPL domain-containing protein [Thermodesulfovibrio thiophilus]|uniref:SIMPL domain-containing protein n=1 Tax=Thermodesulfovibrio thiophilus TaxID=340095 RepID=UPI00042A19AE|nr:SIMPL domain-containing protein [Thermodesulfovibrio thiophilus]
MKKTIFLSIILALFFTCAYAQDKYEKITNVSIILEQTKEIEPDILAMRLEVSVITPKETETINILGAIDKAIKNLNLDYKGGKYSVYKRCWWEKDKQKCQGYRGEIEYIFELKDANAQNQIFETLERFKDKYGEEMNFTVSEPQWIVSKKNTAKIENELKLEVIDTAKDFSEKVSKKLGKTCYISNLDYEIRRPSYGAEPIFLKTKNIEAPEPKKEELVIGVKVSVKLNCK